MIQMDTNGYVVLPVTASFSDASPNLNFNDSGDNSDVIATLSYTYAGQAIGSTNLYMTENTNAQTSPSLTRKPPVKKELNRIPRRTILKKRLSKLISVWSCMGLLQLSLY